MLELDVKIDGLGNLQKVFTNLSGEHDKVEEIVETSMKRIQFNSFKRAPVLTGLLSSTLIAEENVGTYVDKDLIVAELIESIPYATIQEFTNPTKPAFIRTSTSEEIPPLMRDFQAWGKMLERGGSK